MVMGKTLGSSAACLEKKRGLFKQIHLMVILLWLTLFDIAGSFRTSVEKVDCSKREHDFDQIHKVKGYYGFDMDPGWIVAIDFFPQNIPH
jgi:hypothetical protein